jgi:hypothetical protein
MKGTFVSELRTALDPRIMAPGAASLVKSRVNGRRGASAQLLSPSSSGEGGAPATGVPETNAGSPSDVKWPAEDGGEEQEAGEGLSSQVEDQRKALNDRVEWFIKVS